MNAKMQNFPSNNRQLLYKIIPLNTPQLVLVEVSSACDLRCKFCAFSSKSALEYRNHIVKNMDKDTFTLLLEQLKAFPDKFKRICFGGMGEVLMNPDLPYMVKEIKNSGIANEVTTFTNAVNLTHEMSQGFINGGLDIITISVNGLNSDDYERNCGVKINYEKFVEQIKYLYKNKKNLRMNIKTVDLFINNDSDKEIFFNTFGDICDYINIETIAPIHKGVDYHLGDNIKNINHTSKHPGLTAKRQVCPLPFRRLAISSTGKVNFCDQVCGFPYPYNTIDIHEKKLIDLWNGELHKEIMLKSLHGVIEGITEICNNCGMKHCCSHEEDNLDPYISELSERIQNL